MKCLVFDAGPIISLSMNNLLWILKPLKELFQGEFYITECVKKELVDNPLTTKRFKFEAMQVEKLIEEEVIKVAIHTDLKDLTEKLLFISNNCLSAEGYPLHLFHHAEIETLAFAVLSNADAMVIDERITRSLIENPESLRVILERRLHKTVRMNNKNVAEFRQITNPIKIIRSSELVAVAFEKGFLDSYIVSIPNSRKELIDSLLWGVKLNGCAVSQDEIEELKKEVELSKTTY